MKPTINVSNTNSIDGICAHANNIAVTKDLKGKDGTRFVRFLATKFCNANCCMIPQIGYRIITYQNPIGSGVLPKYHP